MNPIFELLNQPASRRIGWALVHSLWQGALIAVLFSLARVVFRRASANTRYLCGCCALALLLALPIGTWLWMGNTAVVVSPGISRGETIARPDAIITANSAANAGTATNSPLPYRVVEFLEQAMPWLVAAWCAGVLLFSLRLFTSWWRLRTLRVKGTASFDAVWIERLDNLKQRLGVSRPVRLLKSALVEVPTVIGWLRPVVLLPASSLTGLTPSQLEAIIAHELAHVCRHDYLVNVFQHVVETLMFYHPATWWISRCVREEREHCCDDLVVKVCGNRMVYARALATLEELRSDTPQLAFAANGGSLLNRIRRLLGIPVNEPSAWRQASGVALMGLGLLLVLGGIGLLLLPPKYRASTQIKVEHDTPHQIEERNGRLTFNYDLSAFQTELAMIRSPLVLNRAIEKLGLRDTWGTRFANGRKLAPDEALKVLTGCISIEQMGSTSLVQIQAHSSDPTEAAQIANEIAESYRNYRIQELFDEARSTLDAQEHLLKEHREQVQEATARLDALRTQLKLVDPNPSGGFTPMITVEASREYQRTLTIQNDSLAHQQARLDNLRKLDRSTLRAAIQTALEQPDPALAALFGELESAEQKLQTVAMNFQTEAPVHKSAQQTIALLNDRIDRKIDGILIGLDNKADQTRASIRTITQQFEIARSNDLAMAEYSRPYYAAKQQLAELIQITTNLGMKLASNKTELMLPGKPQVTIVEHALAPSGAFAPRRGAATSLIVAGLLLGILGAAMRTGRPAMQVSLSGT